MLGIAAAHMPTMPIDDKTMKTEGLHILCNQNFMSEQGGVTEESLAVGAERVICPKLRNSSGFA